MRRAVNPLLIFVFAGLVVLGFSKQEAYFQSRMGVVRALPAPILKVVLGNLTEIGSELLFAHNAAFVGGHEGSDIPDTEIEVVSENLMTSVRLYPEFVDPYYLSQGILPPYGDQFVGIANQILDIGIAADPENIFYPFFKGVNYFYYLGEPVTASHIFRDAAQLPGAPSIFAHLANVLAAEGGELSSAFMSLQILLRDEKEESVKKRYQAEIEMVQKAMVLQEAVVSYMADHNTPPFSLDDLVPNYIGSLPVGNEWFAFQYNAPTVSLVRPKLVNPGEFVRKGPER